MGGLGLEGYSVDIVLIIIGRGPPVQDRSPFDPMIRTSRSATSTRWASARRWSRR